MLSAKLPTLPLLAIIIVMMTHIMLTLLLGIVDIIKFVYDIDIEAFKYVALFRIVIFCLLNPYLYTLTTSLVCDRAKCKKKC